MKRFAHRFHLDRKQALTDWNGLAEAQKLIGCEGEKNGVAGDDGGSALAAAEKSKMLAKNL